MSWSTRFCLSKTMCLIFYFRNRFVFIKVNIFVQKNINVVSNRWESIISLFKDYIPIGSRDNLNSNILKNFGKWKKFLNYCSFQMTWTGSWLLRFFVFSLLCCKSICLMQVQQHNLLTRIPHAGLYSYNGRQIELFHMK